MAKKKSSKKSGVKALMDFITMAIGGLILGFMALPHLKYEVTAFGGTSTENVSGYGLISFEEGANIGLSVVLLIMIITASLMCLFGLLKLLVDVDVIKGVGFGKFVGFGLVVSALATFALAITVCIMVPVACKDDSFNFGGIFSGGKFAVWGSIITNACVAFVGFITSLFAIRD